MISLWIFNHDPRLYQGLNDFLTFVFINTFELAWFIFGLQSIFLGFQNGIYRYFDHQQSEDWDHLRYLLMAIFVWGFINMFFYVMTILSIFALLLAFKL